MSGGVCVYGGNGVTERRLVWVAMNESNKDNCSVIVLKK